MSIRPLRLQDADFRHDYVRCRSESAKPSLKWVPVGMPRLSPDLARCVFFLYGRHPKTNELLGPKGTGVLIGYQADHLGVEIIHIYAITCAHVAPQGASVIRINTTDGKSRLIELGPDDWVTPESGADVAAADITDELIEGDDVSYLSTGWFATKGFIDKVKLGIGDDGFMLGLFALHPGKEYNRVAAKFGNISLMADETDPMRWGGRPPREAHLFDIRSRGGFSGSPVFVYRTPDGDLRSVFDGVRRRTTVAPVIPQQDEADRRVGRRSADSGNWEYEYDTENNIFLRLLGIHAAQYPETVKARKLKKATLESSDDTLKHGDDFLLESGTTIVVPTWEVRDLLNHKHLVERREKRHAQQSRETPVEPSPEAAEDVVTEPARVATEGDDRHKERFTALLDGAVGKPKQGG